MEERNHGITQWPGSGSKGLYSPAVLLGTAKRIGAKRELRKIYDAREDAGYAHAGGTGDFLRNCEEKITRRDRLNVGGVDTKKTV